MSALRSDPPTHILALRVALGFAASLTIAEGWDLEFSFVAALVGATLTMGPTLSVLALVILPPLAKGSYPLVVTNADGASATTAQTTIKYISLF